jgi:hypothetical protein
MSTSDLPDNLLRLIRYCLPDFPAAELLVLLARCEGKVWTIEELVEALRPSLFRPAAVATYLTDFQSRGLVEQPGPDRFLFRPASHELAEAAAALLQAYDERPVSLIRAIYAQADHPIQSFADAFRLRKE